MQDAEGGRLRAAVAKLRAAALAAFMKAYPFMHMAGEGLTFSYQLAYLLQPAVAIFSPGLHLLRQHVVRTSARELVSPHTCMLPVSCLSGVESPIAGTSEAPCVMSDSSVIIIVILNAVLMILSKSSPHHAVWSQCPPGSYSVPDAACAAASWCAPCSCLCGPSPMMMQQSVRAGEPTAVCIAGWLL